MVHGFKFTAFILIMFFPVLATSFLEEKVCDKGNCIENLANQCPPLTCDHASVELEVRKEGICAIIEGGVPPLSIVTGPDQIIARADLEGDYLCISPIGNGDTSVVVCDNCSAEPQCITIPIQVAGCIPEVNITCDPGLMDLCCDFLCGTCLAVTTCNGEEIDGTYTWEFKGVSTIVHTGNNIEICTDDIFEGGSTLTVTDTSNDVTTSGGEIYCDCFSDCFTSVSQDRYPKSHWIPLPALIEIRVDDYDQRPRLTFECEAPGPLPSVIPLLQFSDTGNYPIKQLVVIMPAFLTGNFGEDSELCSVDVEDCSPGGAGFELDILNLGSIPLNE